MKKIKILHLQPQYNIKPFDAVNLAEQINRSIPKEQYEIVNCFIQNSPIENASESGVERNVYLRMDRKDFRGLRIRMRWRLWQFCRKERFDIVICHRFKPAAVIMSICKWIGNPECISVIHSFSDYKPRRRQRIISKVSSNEKWNFVTVSEALKGHLLGLNVGFNKKNTVSITNAIDVEKITSLQLSKYQARQKLGLPIEAKIIGTIGRLAAVKGHVSLIRAFAKICSGFPTAHLAIIGEGVEREALELEIDKLDLKHRVHLLGEIYGAVQYVKAFDIWAMPSLSEGLGLALLEGMSAGIPCIGSDVPAMRPLLKGAGSGIFEPENVEEIAEVITQYLLLSDEELEKKGQETYRYLINNHSIVDFRNSYIDLIKKLHAN